MTRKKQIIEILEKYSVKRVYFNSDDSICAERINVRDEVVDAILALPLDVPSDEEIAKKIQLFRKNKLDGYGNMSIGRLQLGELEWSGLVLDICKWMRDEILKRNK